MNIKGGKLEKWTLNNVIKVENYTYVNPIVDWEPIYRSLPCVEKHSNFLTVFKNESRINDLFSIEQCVINIDVLPIW